MLKNPPTLALIGNPNTGKSTLFNQLTGLRQRIGNYPGVTVERKTGDCITPDGTIQLIDLPGTYSLAAQSPDEMITVDVLLGRVPDTPAITGIVAIVDASNLARNVYLVSQLLECDLPLVIILNMIDCATMRGITIDAQLLSERLGVPVIPICARNSTDMEPVRQALANLAQQRVLKSVHRAPLPNAITVAMTELKQSTPDIAWRDVELLRVLVDTEGYALRRFLAAHPESRTTLETLRATASRAGALATQEACARYAWIRECVQGATTRARLPHGVWSDRIDRIVTHKIYGSIVLTLMTLLVFQSIYTGAAPFMQWIDDGFGALAHIIGQSMPDGALRSLVVHGVIAGVGSVLMFVPQIALLFCFLALLEDCGYMARAAFLMDRLFSRIGLSGKSFIPLLSSFACAIPGIMSTRTIENRQDRIATILVAPLMSCSARLPVYTIMIAAFIPARSWHGVIGWQGATLFAMHALGVVVAIPVIWIIKRTLCRGATPPFVMELPSYKWPTWRLIAYRVFERVKAFVVRAGTLIFAMSIIVWALSYFPHDPQIHTQFESQRHALSAKLDTTARDAALTTLDHAEAGEYLRHSLFATMGHAIAPIVRPLGWDWRIGMATLASFPAREVIIAVLGTIFNIGESTKDDTRSLQTALQAARWPDGRTLFNIPAALSIMVFFALCCQCGSTLITIRRETNTWAYAGFAFAYMTALAYAGAWGIFTLTS